MDESGRVSETGKPAPSEHSLLRPSQESLSKSITDIENSKRQARRNRSVALSCFVVFVGMIGAAYAAVPLYNLFCATTGFGGTTQRASTSSETVIDRLITVRFDANVNHALPWDFQPEQRSITMKMGETQRINYIARNKSALTTVGTSVFNVTPSEAGAYFNKLQCFCFTEQELGPDAQVEMPVEFFVDPDMDQDPELRFVKEITLSYTFFPVKRQETAATGHSVNSADRASAVR